MQKDDKDPKEVLEMGVMTPEKMQAVLCWSLKMLGGLSISEVKLNKFEEEYGGKGKDSMPIIIFNNTNQRWYIQPPKSMQVKRKRGLVKPKAKKLILPVGSKN